MIKLSILVLTYNHGEFISDALQGILNQKMNFNFEVIVSDDFSTDNTLKIIYEFQKKHPLIFNVLESKNNGILQNAFRALEQVKGEYIALLDGDDYWIYNLKLQKQVNFLENNLNYNGVFHDAQIIHEGSADQILFNGKKYYSQNYNYPTEIYINDLLNRLILPTASCVIRTSVLKTIDTSKINDYYSLDWKIYVLAIMGSKFYYFNEVWSVYRNHNKGISKSNKVEFHLSHIVFLKKLLKDEVFKKYKYEIHKQISKELLIIIESKREINHRKKEKLFLKYFLSELKKIYYLRNKKF